LALSIFFVASLTAKTKDIQQAYLNVYHQLYQEKFSANLQHQAGQLMKNR